MDALKRSIANDRGAEPAKGKKPRKASGANAPRPRYRLSEQGGALRPAVQSLGRDSETLSAFIDPRPSPILGDPVAALSNDLVGEQKRYWIGAIPIRAPRSSVMSEPRGSHSFFAMRLSADQAVTLSQIVHLRAPSHE